MLPVLVLAVGVGWVAREVVRRRRRERQCREWQAEQLSYPGRAPVLEAEGARVPAGTDRLPRLVGGDAPPRRSH